MEDRKNFIQDHPGLNLMTSARYSKQENSDLAFYASLNSSYHILESSFSEYISLDTTLLANID